MGQPRRTPDRGALTGSADAQVLALIVALAAGASSSLLPALP